MSHLEVDQLATIHRLTAEFIADLEARGFHRAKIANVVTAFGINLAATCNDPGAFALVIEAALRQMNSQSEPATN